MWIFILINLENMKRIIRTIISLTRLSVVLLICVAADDLYSSKDDPLISLSYANDLLGPQIMTEVLKKKRKMGRKRRG